MTHYKYLIVGGGMTSASAVDGIREIDSKGTIGLISAESNAPYDRPPLSKGLWKGARLRTIWRKTKDQRVKMHLGRTITAVVPNQKRVVDHQGRVFNYDTLLLATGGTPRRLPFGGDLAIYYRTLADYRRLRALCRRGERFAVIGGGFIGSEIAAALALNRKEVVLVFPGKGIGDRLFPRPLSKFVTDYYKKRGVEVLAGEKVVRLEARGKKRVLRTSKNREIVVDAVVAGLGIEPNLALARSARLKIDDGIAVDQFLRTSRPEIFAAGDAAAFYSSALGKRVRVEHEDAANSTGRAAGRNMAGAREPFLHLSFFYSDMFDLGYEAVGEVDSRLATFADWTRPNKEGVIYYLDRGRIRGVLLWNVWGQVDAASQLIAAPGPFTPDDLRGRLPVS